MTKVPNSSFFLRWGPQLSSAVTLEKNCSKLSCKKILNIFPIVLLAIISCNNNKQKFSHPCLKQNQYDKGCLLERTKHINCRSTLLHYETCKAHKKQQKLEAHGYAAVNFCPPVHPREFAPKICPHPGAYASQLLLGGRGLLG